MPKFGTHIIIGEEVAKAMGKHDWLHDSHVGNALRLGAVGPDIMLFLFDPAGGDPKLSFVYKSLQEGLRVYAQIRVFRDKLDEFEAYLGDPTKDLVGWFTGKLSTSILETIGLSVHSFISALKVMVYFESRLKIINPLADLPIEVRELLKKNGIVSDIDVPTLEFTPKLDPEDVTSPAYIFRYFGGPYTVDPPYKEKLEVGDYSEWWWMDVLHYRRTTKFARRLIDLAVLSGSETQLAYAYGYMSHVAADVVGHPYVNSMVGGPFRTHALRHMVIESLMDVQVWNSRKGMDIINSRLDKQISLEDAPRGEICALLHAALTDVYIRPYDGDTPIYTKNFSNEAPSTKDLELAYEVLVGYLGSATDVDLYPPVKPAKNLGEVWDEIRKSLERNVDEIDKYVRDLRTKSGWDLLAALIGLVMWSAVLLIKIMTLPHAVVTAIAAVEPRWLLYLLNSALYDFVRNVRYAMALCGWGYASAADLDRDQSRNLLRVRSRTDNDHYDYPYSMTSRRSGFWLDYPTRLNASIENPRSFAGPYRMSSTPDDFIDAAPFDLARLKELNDVANQADPESTYQLFQSIYYDYDGRSYSALFGNAVDFTLMLVSKQYPDALFDLDGDRGYGCLQWEEFPPNSRYV